MQFNIEEVWLVFYILPLASQGESGVMKEGADIKDNTYVFLPQPHLFRLPPTPQCVWDLLHSLCVLLLMCPMSSIWWTP